MEREGTHKVPFLLLRYVYYIQYVTDEIRPQCCILHTEYYGIIGDEARGTREEDTNVANYRRIVTGVSTVVLLTKTLCKIYLRYQAKIINWVNTQVPSTSRQTVLDWLEAAVVVCAILVTTPDD